MGTQSKADEERTPEEQVQASSKPDVSPLDMSDKIQDNLDPMAAVMLLSTWTPITFITVFWRCFYLV